jgi:tetratricopeptide (TPR) repeat protein
MAIKRESRYKSTCSAQRGSRAPVRWCAGLALACLAAPVGGAAQEQLAEVVQAAPVESAAVEPAPAVGAAPEQSAEVVQAAPAESAAVEPAPAVGTAQEQSAEAMQAAPAESAAATQPPGSDQAAAGTAPETGAPDPGTPGTDDDPAGEPSPTPVGTAEITAAQQAAGEQAVPNEGYVPLPDPVGDYLNAIERAESLSSAYSEELSDLYLGLGRSHLERQEFEQARSAFLRGMQVLRVNYGLNSTEQTNFLFPIADIESLQGNFGAADEVLQNIYLINARNFGTDNPELMPVLNRMLVWYEQRHRMLPPENRYSNMVKVERLTAKIASLVETEKGLSHPDTAAIYRKVGQMHYFMASHLNRYGYSDDEGLAFTTWSQLNSNALPPTMRTHYNLGTAAFTKFVDSVREDENRSALERADAVAQLADWHMVFDKTQTASDTYREAFGILQEEMPKEGLTEEYFGTPKPLHFMTSDAFGTKDSAAEEQTPDNVEVSMTVTRVGRIRDIEIINSPDFLDEDQLQKAERNLSAYRFRPRVVAGEPEATEAFIWHFPVKRNKVSP